MTEKYTKKKNVSSSNIAPKRVRKSSIPKEVANRMARRIAFTTGIPTFLGMGVFILSYWLIIKGITDVPPSITLTSSAIFFLTGLFGLSYGILSASWEEASGSLLGFENIRPNIKKMRSAFKPVNPSNE
ncbi:PAM68 family protein [Prochlorococcus marinus]|uniref:PAM68 family protein n=1 Tax=Prochlorococcus marinus TaxID=1219 RepID=UPI0022B5C2E6|nr:PAM68 family protein [Prochlorococcus marinus]